MQITVEFFGIARRRAGVERMDIPAATFGEALDQIAAELPQWGACCLRDGRLAATFLACRNGRGFLTDRSEPLAEGDSLLILSADVGG